MKTVEEMNENYNSDQGLVFLIHPYFSTTKKISLFKRVKKQV